MSIDVQHLPITTDPFAHLALQGPAASAPTDLQTELTEAVRQLVDELLQELMKQPQVLQDLTDLLQQLAGGSAPAPDNAFSSSRPPAQPLGASPQGGGDGGPAGGGAGPSGTPAASALGATADANATAAHLQTGGVQEPAAQATAPGTSTSSGTSPSPTVQEANAAAGAGPSGMPAALWQHCVDAGQKTGVDPFVLAAQMEKESQYGNRLAGSPSAGDGLMQVEPTTRQAYAAQFESKMGHAYDHANQKDQVALAAVILESKGGDTANMLQKYNGGDQWAPGATDSYGRVIKADEYAATVQSRAAQMKGSAG